MVDGTKLSVNLSPKRKVRVNEYQGRLIVDIREYYEKYGEQLPGSKGIALTPEQFSELAKHVAEIEAILRSNSQSGIKAKHEEKDAKKDSSKKEVKDEVKDEVDEEKVWEDA